MTLQNCRLRPSGPGCSGPDGSRARVYTGRPRACGGIGRRARLRALWTEWSVEVRVLSGALGKPRKSSVSRGSSGGISRETPSSCGKTLARVGKPTRPPERGEPHGSTHTPASTGCAGRRFRCTWRHAPSSTWLLAEPGCGSARLLRALRDHYARQSELYACDLTRQHVFVMPLRASRHDHGRWRSGIPGAPMDSTPRTRSKADAASGTRVPSIVSTEVSAAPAPASNCSTAYKSPHRPQLPPVCRVDRRAA